jgi:hypothetical protein
MAKKREKPLVEKAMDSGNPMALGLALVESNIANANRLNQSIRDSDRARIKELEERVEELEAHIGRTQKRVHRFFFGESEPVYDEDMFFFDRTRD